MHSSNTCTRYCIKCFKVTDLIFIKRNGHYHPHFREEKIETERLSNLPKVTKLVNGKTRFKFNTLVLESMF